MLRLVWGNFKLSVMIATAMDYSRAALDARLPMSVRCGSLSQCTAKCSLSS